MKIVDEISTKMNNYDREEKNRGDRFIKSFIHLKQTRMRYEAAKDRSGSA